MNNFILNNIENPDIYFISEGHKFVFALLFTDKDIRCVLLGITKELYFDKFKATEWYNNIRKNICSIKGCEVAMLKLDQLYHGMVKH